MSSRFPKSQAVCPYGQLLRQKAQRFKFVVEAVKLPAKNFFIVLFLLLQRGNFVDPPLHNRGAAAAALDEIIGLLLIQRDLLLDGRIKFLRHFDALLGIINDVEAVDAQSVIILVYRAELLNERFKRVHFVHVLPRDEIQMPVGADLGGLQHTQIAQADRLNLPPVCARLIKLKQLLRTAAIVQGINLLGDVIVENKQAIEMTSIYRDIINGTRELLSSILDNRLNNVMKYLTSITIVMAIPTVISGLYGMNVNEKWMPFANTANGFGIICLLTLVICLLTLLILRKKKML